MSGLGSHGLLAIALALMAFGIAAASFVSSQAMARRSRIAARVKIVSAATQTKAALPRVRPVPAARKSRQFGADTLTAREAREVADRLGRLGIPADSAIAYFSYGRIGFSLMLAVGTVLMQLTSRGPVNMATVAFAFLALGAGWFVPLVVLRSLAKRRVQTVERALPDAIELLVVAVEAGLALEDGIDRIVTELRRSQPELAEELAITSADLKILPSREVALGNFAARIDVPSVRSIVTTLSQTLRYGTPLAHALRVVSAELRNDGLVRLEERANKMPVLMTLPMMLLIMPSVFLVVGGPALLNVMDNFMR